MSNTDTIVILIAFAAYLMLMIVIGAIYMKNTNNSEDYFLGGRGLQNPMCRLEYHRITSGLSAMQKVVSL